VEKREEKMRGSGTHTFWEKVTPLGIRKAIAFP